jgi:uncharacterized membrane protein YedE/YeeE
MKRFIRALMSIFSGLLFGAGMVISGMVFPEKVSAFLDITGAWDPSLMFVLGGALLVFMPSYHLLIKPRHKPVLAESFSYATTTNVDRRLMIGAAIFGVGWGISGICPGPTVSSLSFGGGNIWVFFAFMMIGLGTTNRAFYRFTEFRAKPVVPSN